MGFKHYPQISKEDIPSINIENVNAYLRDFSISDDKEKPITSGLFRLKAGESLKYTYTYHEMKFIVDGSFTIEPINNEPKNLVIKAPVLSTPY